MYQFKVVWWYDDKKISDYGLVSGSSYKEAMERLIRTYGENEVEECSLKFVGEENGIITFKDGITSIEEYICE